MQWTKEQTQQLRDLWETGLDYKQIGNIMGLTRDAVKGRANRVGLFHRTCKVFISLPPINPDGVPKIPNPENRSDDSGVMSTIISKYLHKRRPPRYTPAVFDNPDNSCSVSLLDAQTWHCRFPIGTDPGKSDFFCGKDIRRGSYCALHSSLCYRGAGAPEDRIRPTGAPAVLEDL